ncbi:MAG: serine/threonine-protein kinase, partial [Planctomycetota bacterium]
MVENAKNIGQSLARQRRIDEICDAFEAAFRRGESPDISAFLDGGPPGDRSELLTALVGLDFELRTTSDDSPRLSDYLADFPNETEAVKLAFEEAVLTDATVFSDPAKEETVSRHDHPSETLATAKGDAPGEFLIERIGRYEIGEVLGEGAFGRVYRARDPKLNREVALKVPTTNATKTDEATKRFAREGRAAAALRHPGICPVFELWDEGETPFIAMAFIEGETLAQRNRSRVYSSIDSVQMVRKLAIALAYAHNKGVVHRDLKPGNIMFDAEQGDPVILDFGLAHFPELDDSVLTQSGVVMGTPTHMSPEQTRGATDEIDERSDVYSLGVIFYELLTGELPFTGSVGEVLGKIQHVNPKLPSSINPEVDSRLEAICMHAMAKEPAKRFQSMEDFATELKRWEESISPTHEPSGAPETRSSFKRWLVVGAAAASILALILLAQSGVLLTVRTDAGTVLVQVDDAANTIRVDVSEDKTVSLTDPNDGQQIELTVDRER